MIFIFIKKVSPAGHCTCCMLRKARAPVGARGRAFPQVAAGPGEVRRARGAQRATLQARQLLLLVGSLVHLQSDSTSAVSLKNLSTLQNPFEVRVLNLTNWWCIGKSAVYLARGVEMRPNRLLALQTSWTHYSENN